VKDFSPLLRSRVAVAVVAGLIWACAFPNVGIAGLAWIAPGLIAAAALGTSGRQSFRLGYIAGLVHYLASLYWLLLIPYRWHGIPLGPATGWLALSAFLALFPATWVWLVQSSTPKGFGVQFNPERIRGAVQSSKLAAQAAQSTEVATNAPASGFESLPATWLGRLRWCLLGATAWVAWEMVLARILGGFPWDVLGVSQYRMVPLIQLASVTGVYGIAFLIVWFSLSLLSAGVMLFRRPTSRSVWIGEIFVPMVVVALVFNFGSRKLVHAAVPERTLKVAFVQPSIPQTLIWDESKDDERFAALVSLSKEALTNNPDLVLWPEAALPKMLRYHEAIFNAVTNLAGGHHAWMIVGSDDTELRPGASNPDDRLYFNSSFLINDAGRLVDRYLKRSLVMFGEYIPLGRWLPFLKWFTPIQGGFTPGEKAGQFELTDLGAKVSILICFEDVFPQLGPGSVDQDTDFLINLTNDGWFGEGAAQWQHAVTGLFRAVENGVPLLRCTNTGLTCWIDAQGRFQDAFRDKGGTIYGAGFMISEIPLRTAEQKLTRTFYNRHGDWFGWTCVAISLGLGAWRLAKLRLLRS
jgi:apolipoprotein N-acyltransferase